MLNILLTPGVSPVVGTTVAESVPLTLEAINDLP